MEKVKKMKHVKKALGLMLALVLTMSSFLGTGALTVEAASNVDITLHKKKFDTQPAEIQNTGEEMTEFATAKGFPGVEFKVYDVTAEFYAVLATAENTMNDAIAAVKDADYSLVTAFQSGTTDANGDYTFTGLPGMSNDEHAVYVFVETEMAGVTAADNMVVVLPIDSPTHPGTELTDIHLYPKNVVKTAGLEVTKVSALDDRITLEGAEFVIHRVGATGTGFYGTTDTEYLEKFDTAGNALWTTNAADAKVYTTASDGIFSEEGLLYGTYFFTEIEAPTGYAIQNDLVDHKFTLDETNTKFIFTAKNDDIVIDKSNTGGTMNVGDVEDYTVTTTIPLGINDLIDKDGDGTADDPRYTKFEIKDNHDDTLELVNDTTLTLSDGTTTFEKGTDYTVTVGTPTGGKGTFTIAFTPVGIAKMTPGAELTVEYGMKLINTAVPGVDYVNEVTVENDFDSATDDGKVVYTGGYNFIKVDGSKNNEALAGAEFVVRNGDADTAGYLKIDETTGDVTWVTTVDDATTFTTGADGYIVIKGLEDGTYYLEETKAPSDKFVELEDRVKFKVEKGSFDTTDPLASGTPEKVINLQKGSLPSTGGTGIYAMMILGVAVMGAAGVFFAYSKRKKA